MDRNEMRMDEWRNFEDYPRVNNRQFRGRNGLLTLGAVRSHLVIQNERQYVAAVSTRKTSLPSVIGNAPAAVIAATSSAVKSPSGPIQTQADFGFAPVLRFKFLKIFPRMLRARLQRRHQRQFERLRSAPEIPSASPALPRAATTRRRIA